VSDERAMNPHKTANDETEQDDVEAHKKLHSQNEEAETDDGDDVEAHLKAHKNT
jgi:hypothetical protein